MKNDEMATIFKTIADSFLALSEICSSGTEEEKQPKAKKNTPSKKAKPGAETPAYTKEDVRAMLSKKAKEDDCKYKADVKKLVGKYSSDGTLTKVPEDKYPELMAELEMMGNG